MNLDDFLDKHLNDPVEVPDTQEGYFDRLKGIIETDYSGSLTEDDVIHDPRLMEYVYGFLEKRRGPEAGSLGNQAYGLATGLGGGSRVGSLTTDYRNLDPKEAWEIFQNHQRSFAGGQTVTTLNELAYAGNSDGETKEYLGSGYYLFDQMDNVFTGDGSWKDMGDAIWDYGKAAVWDPTTIASIGIGKLATGGASKASSVAVKQAMLEGVKSGVTKTAMKKGALKSSVFAGTVLASEALMEAGKDIAFQDTLIDTGAQEEYSAGQTIAAAAAATLVPLGAYGINKGVGALRNSKLLNKSIVGNSMDADMSLKLTAEEALEKVEKRISKSTLIDAVDDSFGNIKGDTSATVPWESLKQGDVELDVSSMSDVQFETAFLRRFWLGSKDGAKKGYQEALIEAGFVVHPSMVEAAGNKSAVYANAIEYLDDEVVERSMKAFEEAYGRKLPFVDRTAKGMNKAWSMAISESAKNLWLVSSLSKVGKAGANPKDLVEGLLSPKVKNPRWIPYALSVYKRNLTAHPATTGANLKGFAALSALDTAGDTVSGMIYKAGELGARAMDTLSPSNGWDVIATEHGNMALGSFTGAAKKGISVFSPEMSYDYAEKVLHEFPELSQELLNHLAGDSGINDAATFFNVDGKPAVSAIEKYVSATQAVSLVRVQDEITKKLYFGSALDKNITKVYGVSPTKFWENPDSLLEMHSDVFRDKVLKKALSETQDVTASKTWSAQPKYGSGLSFRNAAAWFETVSRESAVGYVVPFASFMNTTMMHVGDYSGMNSVRNLYKEALGVPMDYSQKSGVELAGKAIVGWGTVATMVPTAMDKIKDGLNWNQERREDGSVQDVKYDWPINQIHLLAHAVAHAQTEDPKKADPSRIPDSLWDDFKQIATDPSFGQIREDLGKEVLGGQGIKGMFDTIETMYRVAEKASIEGMTQDLLFNDMLGPMVATAMQGHTRPLDPLNAMVGLAKGGNMTPDRSQGNRNVRQALRYVDQITGVADDWERKATPELGKHTNADVDFGKLAGGVRSNPVPSLWESMSNSAGLDTWKSISKNWTGGPEVRNVANSLVYPVLQNEASRAISQNPDFFQWDIADKQKLMQRVNERSRETVREMIANGVGGKGLIHLTALSSVKKAELRKVMDFLELEGKPEDYLDDPNGEEILRRILYLSKNFDDIFNDKDYK